MDCLICGTKMKRKILPKNQRVEFTHIHVCGECGQMFMDASSRVNPNDPKWVEAVGG